ncbi:hypothetical protein EB796_012910 [Bugula neritina]|uniref:Secreted protein n=1 Tax=Bugula neritina TaxID=10212 RepID=A0A7J7JSZ0_BUGNE|nr:hypothetical protein EB796_012910 [Bugula neritina]
MMIVLILHLFTCFRNIDCDAVCYLYPQKRSNNSEFPQRSPEVWPKHYKTEVFWRWIFTEFIIYSVISFEIMQIQLRF